MDFVDETQADLSQRKFYSSERNLVNPIQAMLNKQWLSSQVDTQTFNLWSVHASDWSASPKGEVAARLSTFI